MRLNLALLCVAAVGTRVSPEPDKSSRTKMPPNTIRVPFFFERREGAREPAGTEWERSTHPPGGDGGRNQDGPRGVLVCVGCSAMRRVLPATGSASTACTRSDSCETDLSCT